MRFTEIQKSPGIYLKDTKVAIFDVGKYQYRLNLNGGSIFKQGEFHGLKKGIYVIMCKACELTPGVLSRKVIFIWYRISI